MNIVTQKRATLVNAAHVRYFHVHKDSIMARLGDDDSVELYSNDNSETVGKVFEILVGEVKKRDDWIEMDDLHRKATGEAQAPGVIIG